MNSLGQYYEKYKKLGFKYNLSGEEALEAVKKNGFALQYVKTQTPEICLEAIRQNGLALQYVNEDMFSSAKELTVSEIEKLLGYSVKIVK